MYFAGKRKLFALLVLLIAFSFQLNGQTFADPRFTTETVATVPPYSPIGFVFAPDGRIFIWQKSGKIQQVKNGTVTLYMDISARVNRAIDRGLIGMALDPDFATTGYFYLAYVYEDKAANTSDLPRTQRVSRFQQDPANSNLGLASSESVLIGKVGTSPCPEPLNGADCIPNDVGTHTIDHLAFGPDGKLYVSIGDGATYKSAAIESFRAQEVNHPNGKLLRINKDGSAPPDNPFYDGTNSFRSKVYSYGLRNPYRFSIHPTSGRVFIGDVGWTKFEEVDTGKGQNFGWPCFEGPNKQPEFQFNYQRCRDMNIASTTLPAFSYDRNTGTTVIMGPLYDKTLYPSEYQDRLYFADYGGQWIRSAAVDANGVMTDVRVFASGILDPVFLTLGPDGMLYYIEFSTGKIKRIRFNNSNRAPVAAATANPAYGASPLTVAFTNASTDPDGDTLTYSWNFGDGFTSTEQNPSHTFVTATPQSFAVTLTVTDPSGATNTATIKVVAGSTPPTANITAPADGMVVSDGDVVNFAGTGTDPEDGALSGASLAWSIYLRHNTHRHVLGNFTGSGGSFTINSNDNIDTYSYEIDLTVTDSTGLTHSQQIVLPYRFPSACPMSTVNPSVTICTPAEGAAVSSPVNIVAGTTSSYPITAMKIYVDNVEKYSTAAGTLNTDLEMAAGKRYVVVQAWNTNGQVFKSARTITVGTASGATTPCALNSASPSVTICQPTQGATLDSPVRIVAGTTSSAPVTAIKIYVDNVEKYSISNASSLDTSLAMAAGAHNVVVQAWNSSGEVFKSQVTVTVNGGGGTTPCTLSATSPSVTICEPTEGATVASPVRVVAGTTSSTPVTAIKIYVDNQVAYSASNVSSIDTSLTLAAGAHYVVVQAWNSAGQVFKSARNITVGGGSGTPPSCTASTTSPSVTICSPAQGSTVSSPVRITALTTSSTTIAAIKVYVDNVDTYTVRNSASLDVELPMSSGTHNIVVQAWNSAGQVFNSSRTVTVSGVSTMSSCAAGTTNNSVTICEPTQGATVASPVRVVAKTTSASSITGIKIYVDHVEKYSINNVNQIDTSLALPAGNHLIVVQAWNSAGAVFNASRNITVSP